MSKQKSDFDLEYEIEDLKAENLQLKAELEQANETLEFGKQQTEVNYADYRKEIEALNAELEQAKSDLLTHGRVVKGQQATIEHLQIENVELQEIAESYRANLMKCIEALEKYKHTKVPIDGDRSTGTIFPFAQWAITKARAALDVEKK